jgi:hypothetical protein
MEEKLCAITENFSTFSSRIFFRNVCKIVEAPIDFLTSKNKNGTLIQLRLVPILTPQKLTKDEQ